MKFLKLLLIDINRVSLDTSIDMQEYPLGLLYVATTLRQAFGDQIKIKIESYNEKSDRIEKIRHLLGTFKPDIVGLRSLTMGREPLHRIARLAKQEYQIPLVIAGGPHATDSPEDILANESFDCAVLGEGEETAVQIVSHFLAGQSLNTVQGVALRSDGGGLIRSVRPPIENLDDLPVPDYRLIDFMEMNRGFVDFSFRINEPHANLFTSRGCPYRCIYCHHVFGKKYRIHSPERIFNEIKILHDEYGIRKFQIIDDIFNLDKPRAMRFFEMVVQSRLNLEFSFPNGLRGDRMDAELIDAMWEAGVRYIAYAIESGSPRIQKIICKHIELESLQEAISLTTRKGIVTKGFFMIGFPSETEKEALMTVQYANRSDLVLAMFFTVVYFPGTPLYRLASRLSNMAEFDLGLEDDYVRTREGPYNFSKETLEAVKLKAIREFFFSSKRLRLFFDLMPNFYNRRDMDASILVSIISGRIEEANVQNSGYKEILHRYFIMADRFSKKTGFYV